MNKLAFIILFVISDQILADGFKTENDIRQFSDKFVSQIINEEFQKAFDSAKKYWPMPAVEIDGLANKINQQWPIVRQRFGKAVEKEFIKKERIGKSFIRYYYLHKFENHAIYWRLDFYKPNKIWTINSLVFLDALDSLYE